ncbi:MAG: hypothetical protein ACLQNE_33345 [Thermoguttaceae bacterium]
MAIDLKIGDFRPADAGQMELYLRWRNEYERRPDEEEPVGITGTGPARASPSGRRAGRAAGRCGALPGVPAGCGGLRGSPAGGSGPCCDRRGRSARLPCRRHGNCRRRSRRRCWWSACPT